MITLLLVLALGAMKLLAPLALRLEPYICYRAFPWQEQQLENGGHE